MTSVHHADNCDEVVNDYQSDLMMIHRGSSQASHPSSTGVFTRNEGSQPSFLAMQHQLY